LVGIAYLGHQHKEFQLIFFYGSLSDNGLLFYSNDIVLLMEVVLVEVVAEVEEFMLSNLAEVYLAESESH
jgi:hypothetical protein